MTKINWKILVLFMIILLAGCSEKKDQGNAIVPDESITLEEESENETNVEKENEEDVEEQVQAQPLPQTLAELEALPAGHTAPYLSAIDPEDQKVIDELTKDLPDISGNPTENELNNYYNQLVAVFQQDYLGPEELISKLKFQAIGSPDIENPRMQFKENLNVLVLLDASGSMRNNSGGKTQMDAAKEAITDFVEGLPAEANVGLRIYGHKGSGSSKDKAMSCSSSDLIYPLSPFEKASFETSLNQAIPAGWTPTGFALKEAAKDLSTFPGEQNTNIVYLVSDGVATCDDDPVGAAKALYDSDITPIINVIGFNVDTDGQRQLKEVAKAVNGSYQNVQDKETLLQELEQANEVAKKWVDWKKNKESRLKGDQISNGLEIFMYDAKEYRKIVDERQQIGFGLQYLYQTKKRMSRESHDYLRARNTEYHDWIQSEYDELKKELKDMNDMQFNEAIQALEDKYLQNAPE